MGADENRLTRQSGYIGRVWLWDNTKEGNMNDIYLDVGQKALVTAIALATPLLGAALLVGITISIFQAVTGIQEQTLIFIPKIVAIAMVLLFLGPWMGRVVVRFTVDIYTNIHLFIR